MRCTVRGALLLSKSSTVRRTSETDDTFTQLPSSTVIVL